MARTPNNKIVRDLFHGFVKVHILHHASQEGVYGHWLIGELAEHGYRLSPGTLYPLLHSLAETGYLRREERIVNGRVRKYYRTTSLGKRALDAVKTQIQVLVDEISESGPGPAPRSQSHAGRAAAAAEDASTRNGDISVKPSEEPILGRIERTQPRDSGI